MSNPKGRPERKMKRKQMRDAAKQAIKKVNMTQMQEKKYNMALEQFKKSFIEVVKTKVNPRWVKLSNHVPPEWYFNFIKGICEKLYGDESVNKLIEYAKKHNWSYFRFDFNLIPRKFIGNVIFYLTLKWLMAIQRRLRIFGVSNRIVEIEKGVLKQTVKFHGKVVRENKVKYG